MDQRGRSRAADPAGPGALRRGGSRPHRPRTALHGARQPARPHLPGSPRRRLDRQRVRTADGAAPAAQGVRRPLALPGAGAGAAADAQDVRDDPGRQRVGVLHLGRAGPRLGRRRHAHHQRDQGLGLRGRRHHGLRQRPVRTRRALAAAAAALVLGTAAGAAPAVQRPFPGAPRCQAFPDGNVWNQRVDRLPVAKDSAQLIAAIGADAALHPDFSSIRGGNYGIPFTVVSNATPRAHVSFDYADESDRVSYPIPKGVKIEGGGDRHALLIDRDACKLYELYGLARRNGRWHAGSGAVYDLRSNRLRPDGWTSADAAGLPILPGLVRADEVAAGAIRHALRFTAPRTRDRHVYPARHDAGDSDPSLPPMGLRVRLRASVDISGFPRQARVVLQALKAYGMLLADNGSPWYVSGAPSPVFDDDALHALQRIRGSDLEV